MLRKLEEGSSEGHEASDNVRELAHDDNALLIFDGRQ
jgi:hypothetical protein